MYRVELKEAGSVKAGYLLCSVVPNVPCGVERIESLPRTRHTKNKFLMYRVELKVGHGLRQRNREDSHRNKIDPPNVNDHPTL